MNALFTAPSAQSKIHAVRIPDLKTSRDPKGRFAKLEDGLPPMPETVPFEQFSKAFSRAERMAAVAHRLRMHWAVLAPVIEDELGRNTGPCNFMLKGGGEDLYVLSKERAEVLDFHLMEIGTMIAELSVAEALDADRE